MTRLTIQKFVPIDIHCCNQPNNKTYIEIFHILEDNKIIKINKTYCSLNCASTNLFLNKNKLCKCGITRQYWNKNFLENILNSVCFNCSQSSYTRFLKCNNCLKNIKHENDGIRCCSGGIYCSNICGWENIKDHNKICTRKNLLFTSPR